MDVTLFETIDSTNSHALRLIDGATSSSELASLHGKIFVAKEQTAGRGRMNRPFYSPQKTGIYFTMIYVPEAADDTTSSGNVVSDNVTSEVGASGDQSCDLAFSPAVFTATAGVCVCRVLEKMFGVNCFIKWVNDIYIEDRKVCGILTEGRVDASKGCITAFVVGIGINLVTSNFPDEIKNRAGRVLKTETELKDEVYTQIPLEVFGMFTEIVKDAQKVAEAMAEYKKRSNLLGKTVTVSPVINSSEKNYEALVSDITQNALLVVRLPDGTTRTLDSGEVSVKM